MNDIVKQHLIDPGICIRCNTCEETCPVKAITHDSRNYVVKAEVCNDCRACVPPCPTGAIDNWFPIAPGKPYTLEEQYSWDELPAAAPVTTAAGEPEDVARLTSEATAGQGGPVAAPWSAEKPAVNLYSEKGPISATVAGNFRLTGDNASADIRHIVLDFGGVHFPLLEGQNIGIVPPGTDAQGRPHHVRLYSVASPREGERPGYHNCAITVKRVTEDHEGKPAGRLLELPVRPEEGRQGAGHRPLRRHLPHAQPRRQLADDDLHRHRLGADARHDRAAPPPHGTQEGGELMLFFGARAPDELPYFGPLMKLPKEFIDINFAFSRVPGKPKQYVQDLIRERHDAVWRQLNDENCYIYLCGLKGMEKGVDEAFRDVCRLVGDRPNRVGRALHCARFAPFATVA
jgi:benzoyl-CoA 2,3-dioxygenase component A